MQCLPLANGLMHCAPQWDEFASAIDDLLKQLLPLNPNLVWQVRGTSGLHIGQVTAGDFAFKLANISWMLVDGNDVQNGGVGAVVSHFKNNDWQDPSDWIKAEETIDAGAFRRYLDLPGGLHYLILHETAHTTELGIRTNNTMFDQYVHKGGDRNSGDAWSNSPEWNYNEQVANAIARTVADAFNLGILDHPTCGLPDGQFRPLIRTGELITV